jgi:hypothetical protein
MPQRPRTIGDVRRLNAENGQHWFEAGTMRFFSSRVPRDSTLLISGRYFVSSERDESPYQHAGSVRAYTIREAFSDGSVDTVGEFQGYATKAAAEKAARALPHEYSAALMAVLESDTHNRTGWIRQGSQLSRYTGKPLADCREVIAARAKQRRRERAAA